MSPDFQVNELARKLGEAFGGTFRYLYAPVFTESLEAWKIISETNEVQQVASQWPILDRALVGIGHVEFQHITSMFFGEHISLDVMAQLEAKEAVGDICGNFYDQHGNPIPIDVGVISVGLEELRELPNVTAVAGGLDKVRAILGALRGGFINVLVTDTVTASALLERNN